MHINSSWFCRQGVTQGVHLGIKSPFNLHFSYFQGNFSETGANCSFSFKELPHPLAQPWVSSCSNHSPRAVFSAHKLLTLLLVRQQHSPVLLAGLERRNELCGCAKATLAFPSGTVPWPALPTRLCSRTTNSRLLWVLCPALAVAQSIFFLSLAQPGSKQVSAEGGRKKRGCSALLLLFFLSPLGWTPTIPGKIFLAQCGIWKSHSSQLHIFPLTSFQHS